MTYEPECTCGRCGEPADGLHDSRQHGPLCDTCWGEEFSFECVACGEITHPDRGAHDAVERALEDSERGVCDGCFVALPPHVHDWAAERKATP